MAAFFVEKWLEMDFFSGPGEPSLGSEGVWHVGLLFLMAEGRSLVAGCGFFCRKMAGGGFFSLFGEAGLGFGGVWYVGLVFGMAVGELLVAAGRFFLSKFGGGLDFFTRLVRLVWALGGSGMWVRWF